MNTKAGYVTIIGKPNVGKSTLMNKLLNEKLSIVTQKPQTTRKRILGILTDEETQIIFYDTPGILKPEYLMHRKMMEFVNYSIKDADVLVMIFDIEEDLHGDITLNDENITAALSKFDGNKIALINKIDKVTQPQVTDLVNKLSDLKMFSDIVPVSAKFQFNLEQVLDSIKKYLPIHPKYFPDDQLTDESERFYVSEIIREKILELYREEVPYSVEILIEEFKERENAKDFIGASIIVERDSQKPIIIGKGGEMIKKLGQFSRTAVEEFLQREVYLELRVKVKEHWRTDAKQLNRFGYNLNDKE